MVARSPGPPLWALISALDLEVLYYCGGPIFFPHTVWQLEAYLLVEGTIIPDLCVTSQSRLESSFAAQEYSGVWGDVRGAVGVLKVNSYWGSPTSDYGFRISREDVDVFFYSLHQLRLLRW